MTEPTARIDAVHSFREPEGSLISGQPKEKQKRHPKPPRNTELLKSAEDEVESDGQEHHQLDTLA